MDDLGGKFERLYESIISERKDIFEEKTNPAKTKHPNRPKTRKTEHKRNIKRSQDANKPIEHQRHDMKLSRGQQRKRQNFVPAYRSIRGDNDLPTAKKILTIAKKASSGIWKLSKRQVVEIAAKYGFNVPGPTKRTRHLGSTGIIMWRKNSREYFLVKLGKNQRDNTRYT